MYVTIFGSGASGGVPLIGCTCPVCTSDNPKNRRSRVSVLIEQDGFRLLIDTSPDLREQCLRHDITTVDAIFYTHAHADHTHGIDDIRALNYHADAPIPVYADGITLAELRQRFGYAFEPPIPEFGWFRPALIAHEIAAPQTVAIGPFSIRLFEQQHGRHPTLGLRIGNFAYSTDTNHLPEDAFSALDGVDTWVVDCLGRSPAPTHAHLTLALEWIARTNPRQAYLTHLSHVFDYEELNSELPSHIQPAWDGLTFRC